MQVGRLVEGILGDYPMFNVYGCVIQGFVYGGECVFRVQNIVFPVERLVRRIWWDYSLTAYMRLQCMIGSLIREYGIL